MIGSSSSLLAAALAIWAPPALGQNGASCERDLADLERVSEAVVLGSTTKREVALLLHAAKSDCEQGRSQEATAQLGEAWAQILDDRSLLAPTVPKLASDPCSHGMGALEQQVATTEAGTLARQTADDLMAEARRLCREGQELDAEEKLSMAWAMLTSKREVTKTSD